VQAAQAARDFASQSLDAEQKKYRLGASTTALVLQQQRTWRRRRTTDLGDGGVCEGPRGAGAAAVEHTGPYGISIRMRRREWWERLR